MFSFKVDSWQEFQNQEYLKGTFLWIIHADKIPPHIGISMDGYYFSLKVSGKDESVSINSLVSIVNSKKIPTLAIEIIDKSFDLNKLQRVFEQFDRAESSTSSCLTPISNLYFPESDDMILSELLTAIQEKHTMGKIYGFNLKDSFKGVPAYGRLEITNRLIELEDVKRR